MKITKIIPVLLLIPFFNFAQLNSIKYTDNQQILNGLGAKPKVTLQDKPGILILPAWKGIDAHAKDSAEKLSKLGYYAFIADIYGEGNYPKNNSEAGERAGFYKTNRNQYQQRIRLALNQLIQSGANPEKIVVMGYCFGGTGALEAARAEMPVKGVVSFHGGLAKGNLKSTQNITAKVLICHGADDPYESSEEITGFQKEMRDAHADWQMIYYANAVHSFTDADAGNDNSKGAAYNEKADKRSWEHLLIFLKEVL
jgi:dienelactone hydrolase